jgi:hypothetical protein
MKTIQEYFTKIVLVFGSKSILGRLPSGTPKVM